MKKGKYPSASCRRNLESHHHAKVADIDLVFIGTILPSRFINVYHMYVVKFEFLLRRNQSLPTIYAQARKYPCARR